uniref:Death domain-associated protein 6 n=1 Tax=Neogobius melanostomus TaxID=47308 RepID=A0A8C6UAB1_9GOBI
MAVAPASLADKIVVLDDDDDEEMTPQPSTAVSRRSSQKNVKQVSPLKAQQSLPTHIVHSPFASSKRETHVIKAENEKLFTEFVEYCTAQTQDCPEVITFLQTKHDKASPTFLTSVEFRNVLGRCLTRAQANRAKTFVYINELCTVLRQHGIKKRQSLVQHETPTSQSASVDQPKAEGKAGAVEEDEQPSTSGVSEDPEAGRKAQRKSRKQIAYLENLLKVYNEEIRHLQEAELSLDDLGTEDSLYIQEHKLKRKMMKIYEKLCEIKDCSTLTGRVLEQRIDYRGSRYPEINKRIEKFINSTEARIDAPDYQDILQVVRRANERHNLRLPRKQLNDIAKEAFRETASRIQDRRHLDLVYNFGSHLTDAYKPTSDPALEDPSLQRKLRSNRELAIDRLNDVISKYTSKQEDTEEQERLKRSEKDKSNKEGNASKNQEAQANGVEEEEEDDEEDQSSDPDIEEEIEASTQLDLTEGASEEETNEAEQAVDDEEDQDQMPPSVSVSERDGTSPVTSARCPSRASPPPHPSPTPPPRPGQPQPVGAQRRAAASQQRDGGILHHHQPSGGGFYPSCERQKHCGQWGGRGERCDFGDAGSGGEARGHHQHVAHGNAPDDTIAEEEEGGDDAGKDHAHRLMWQ